MTVRQQCLEIFVEEFRYVKVSGQQAAFLRVLQHSDVTEDVLVRHLDGEGSLRSDQLHHRLHVQSADVVEQIHANVRADKCTCNNGL